MPVEKHPIGARHAESGPSVLALLKTPLAPEVVRYTLEQKIEGYREQIATTELALTKQRNGATICLDNWLWKKRRIRQSSL